MDVGCGKTLNPEFGGQKGAKVGRCAPGERDCDRRRSTARATRILRRNPPRTLDPPSPVSLSDGTKSRERSGIQIYAACLSGRTCFFAHFGQVPKISSVWVMFS